MSYSSYQNQQQMLERIEKLEKVLAAAEANIQLLNDRVTALEMVITTTEEA